MRISDWSSDVCSSDLGAQIGTLLDPDRPDGAALETGGVRAFGEQDTLRAHRHGDALPLADGVRRDRRQRRQSGNRHAHPAVGRFQCLALEEIAGADEVGDDRVERPFRSEEHTSELQSLMRISYAVFCLKKKTKKK